MATIHLTPEQETALEGRRRALLRHRIPQWGILIGIVVLAVLTAQYLFLIACAVIAAFVVLMFIQVPAHVAERREQDPFLSVPHEVVLRPDRYTIRLRDNVIELAAVDLRQVEVLRGGYRLWHRSNIDTALPKEALSEAEIEVVEGYLREHPPKFWPW